MKKLVLFLTIFLISSCTKQTPETPYEKINFRNGIAYEINSTIPYSGIVTTNEWNFVYFYDPERSPRYARINYIDGEVSGLYEEYYDSGQLRIKANLAYEAAESENYTRGKGGSDSNLYLMALPLGRYESYYQNGQTKQLIFFVNEDGHYYGDKFTESGSLDLRGHINKNYLANPNTEVRGYYEFFDKDGNLTKMEIITNENFIQCDYLELTIRKVTFGTGQESFLDGSPSEEEVCKVDESEFTYYVE